MWALYLLGFLIGFGAGFLAGVGAYIILTAYVRRLGK